MVNGQGLPVQLICHTKPYNNRNLQSMVLRDSLVYESDNWSTTNFGLLFLMVCFVFCVWPSFIGAVLSVMKAYSCVCVYCGVRSLCSVFMYCCLFVCLFLSVHVKNNTAEVLFHIQCTSIGPVIRAFYTRSNNPHLFEIFRATDILLRRIFLSLVLYNVVRFRDPV